MHDSRGRDVDETNARGAKELHVVPCMGRYAHTGTYAYAYV